MQKLIKSSEYSSGYFADSRKESLKFDEFDMFQKYKCSSPAVFGEIYNCETPIQLRLSPIETTQKSCFSMFSENNDFSVKDISRKFNNISQQSYVQNENEEERKKIVQLIIKEQITLEEQKILSIKQKKIRDQTNKKLEELDQQYIQKKELLLKQLQQQNTKQIITQTITQNFDDITYSSNKEQQQPLKSALKKKENQRQHTYEKYYNQFDDSQDDWNFIHQAKINLEKQRTQQNLDDINKSPSKVRFVNSKELQPKNLSKKFKQTLNVKDLNTVQKFRF